MNLFRSILPIFAFTFLSLLCISAASGQTVPNTRLDPNFQAVLHVILGSADADQGAALPKSLSGISSQLRSNFNFTNYKLVNTYLGRIADTGTLEYKSMANIYGQEQESETPSFLDWRLGGFKRVDDTPGRGLFQVQTFRFGARVPIKMQTTVNYESLGLSLDKLSISENSPTLIGTLSLPRTTGTVFLVLTVKSLEN